MSAETPALIPCWRGSDGDVEPVACECEVFGYPNLTTAGDKMYENSHYLSRAEAWEHIDRSIRAQLFSASRSLENARAVLRKAEVEMVEAGVRMAEINRRRYP